jgi:hypothetical protein
VAAKGPTKPKRSRLIETASPIVVPAEFLFQRHEEDARGAAETGGGQQGDEGDGGDDPRVVDGGPAGCGDLHGRDLLLGGPVKASDEIGQLAKAGAPARGRRSLRA